MAARAEVRHAHDFGALPGNVEKHGLIAAGRRDGWSPRPSPADVTMQKIATEAGLSVGAAYRSFDSRDELFGAALDRMAERLAQGIADPPTVAGITALVCIAGQIYGPTINRALQRDPEDRRLYDGATEMMANWIVAQDRPDELPVAGAPAPDGLI